MNYYSVEFFKHNFKELNAHISRMKKLKSIDESNLNVISNRLDEMLGFIKDREEHNDKFVYNKKHMKQIDFKLNA